MNKKNITLATVAAGICLLGALTAAAQNPIVANFGFETPTTSSYIYNPSGGSWAFTPSGSSLGSGVTVNNSGFTSANPPAPEGTQVGFLQNSATISQTISGFTAGMSYTISFAAANRARSGYATPQRWDVRIDGVTQASFANVPTSYTNCTVNFTATASSHTLAFVGTSNVDATVFLDNVSVTPNLPTSAPVFTNVMRAGSDIILQGTNGASNGAYEMLRSTNVSAPVGNWQGVGVRPFDANGNFSFTNPITSEVAAAFYRLLVVSSVPVFAPAITGQPQNAGIAVGQNANFGVTATGTAPLTYRWYFNTNTLLTTGSSASLTITNAQLTNAGKYSVTVSNLVGTTNSVFATLTVTNNTQPPSILAQPTNLTVFVGQTANFGVTATGALPLRYQWYFNTNTVLAGKTNSTLTLTNVQLTNAGRYSVTITNLFGTTNSAFAALTVNSNANPELIGWGSVAGAGLTTTTGGGTNTPTVVTDLVTLRSLAGDSTPRVLLLSGTFNAGSSVINIANNKTLRGVGPNVVINGGINMNGNYNIIVQNLAINALGGPADAAAARTCHHLWFDHVTFSDAGDGLLDLTVASDFITVSWCKFYYTDPNNGHRLASLVGNSSESTGDTGHNRVTYHHNWFSTLVDQRMPRLLFGLGHMFNNYYFAPGNGYCIGTGSWGSALVENNYFKQVNSPHQSQDGNPSYIVATGNVYDNCTGNRHTGLLNPDASGNPGPWTPPYSYTLEPAANVPASVTLGAGPQ